MEFPRKKLNLLDCVGSGVFAAVYKAEAIGILKPKETSIVAVKVLKGMFDSVLHASYIIGL